MHSLGAVWGVHFTPARGVCHEPKRWGATHPPPRTEAFGQHAYTIVGLGGESKREIVSFRLSVITRAVVVRGCRHRYPHVWGGGWEACFPKHARPRAGTTVFLQCRPRVGLPVFFVAPFAWAAVPPTRGGAVFFHDALCLGGTAEEALPRPVGGCVWGV